MPFSKHDAPTNAVLWRAFDEAWRELGGATARSVAWRAATTAQLIKQLSAAADAGERDLRQLKHFGTRGVERAKHTD